MRPCEIDRHALQSVCLEPYSTDNGATAAGWPSLMRSSGSASLSCNFSATGIFTIGFWPYCGSEGDRPSCYYLVVDWVIEPSFFSLIDVIVLIVFCYVRSLSVRFFFFTDIWKLCLLVLPLGSPIQPMT